MISDILVITHITQPHEEAYECIAIQIEAELFVPDATRGTSRTTWPNTRSKAKPLKIRAMWSSSGKSINRKKPSVSATRSNEAILIVYSPRSP